MAGSLLLRRFSAISIVRAIAPNTEPMLDSGSMCASASKLFAASRSLLPGSLALLLRR
jgi:hypothetical protein